jgi:hypothetical protein
MANGHKVDLKKLEKRATALSDALSELGNPEDFRRLILEWRRPGWTTPAELIFVTGILESMSAHTAALNGLKGTLLNGSKAVTAG